MEEQDREQSPRFGCIQPDNAALGDHLERTEDPELHASIVAERRTPYNSGTLPALDRGSTRPPHSRRIGA